MTAIATQMPVQTAPPTTTQTASPTTTQTAPPEQGAAFVPRAGGPPDTSNYLIAGYLVTFAIYAGYIVLLLRRMAHTRRG